MSVLLVGATLEAGLSTARRLHAQGDEVRAIEPDIETGDALRAAGVYVAVGDASDDDLVERASQNVRTVVIFGRVRLEPVLEGAARAGVGRVIACAPRLDLDRLSMLRASGLDYVVLATGRGGILSRSGISSEVVAQAIDAADDLAGQPRLELDLTQDDSWATLALPPPSSR